MYCTAGPLEPFTKSARPFCTTLDDRATDDGVDDPALATEETGTTDDSGTDGEQQDVAVVSGSATPPTFEAISMPPTAAISEQITKTEIRMRSTVDTGAAGRLLVATDRVDVSAVARAAEHELNTTKKNRGTALPTGRLRARAGSPCT